MTTKKRHKLVIEAGPEHLKWSYAADSGGGFVVEERGSGAADDATARSLAELAKSRKLRDEEIVSCFPRHQVTVRNLELPSVDPAEIKKIVDLQAAKQTPYASEEIVFDTRILDSHREGYSSVMLVIVHRDVLNGHLRLLNDAGLKPRHLSVSTLGVAAAVQLSSAEEIVAVLDVDERHTEFLVARAGKALFTQTLSMGAEKMTTDGEWKEKFLEELGRSIQIYRSEEIDREPAALLVGGAWRALEPSLDAVSRASGLPVKTLPDTVKTTPDSKLSFLAVDGFAAAGEMPSLNLIPQEVALSESLEENSRRLVTTGILALSIFLVLVASVSEKYYSRLSYLRWLEKKAAELSAPAEDVSQKRSRMKEVARIRRVGNRLFNAFAFALGAVPERIYLNEINWTQDGRLFFLGRSDTMPGVFDLVAKLKSEPSFAQVETKRLTKRIVENREVVDFEIEAAVSMEGKSSA